MRYTPRRTSPGTIAVGSGAAGFAAGSIAFNNNSAVNDALRAGTPGPDLVPDDGGAGASPTSNGAGPGLGDRSVSAAMAFNDDVTAAVNYAANATTGVTTRGSGHADTAEDRSEFASSWQGG